MARREIPSEISGRVWKIEARAGDRLDCGATILVIESMKMEIPVAAPASGILLDVRVAEREAVEEGQVLAVLDAE